MATKHLVLFSLAALLGSSGIAAAQVKTRDHRAPAAPPPPPAWDSTGWTSLGERTVDGKLDRDVIPVGVADGWFSKLTLVVEDSDLELFDLVVTFGNDETYSPTTRLVFKEGSRSRAIDLPGGARKVRKVAFRYGNLPGGGKARMRLWGMAVAPPPPPPSPPPAATPPPPPPPPPPAATPPPPPPPPVAPPPPPVFDARGWSLLGKTVMYGKKRRETIEVGRYEGRFDQLTLVIADGEVAVEKFVVLFANGEKFEPALRHVFKEGQRSRAIDLPGNDRVIQKIDVRYRNANRRHRGEVMVYGRDTRGGADAPEPRWDGAGWERLGEARVDGARDRDVIAIGRDDGRFTALTFAVEDSAVEIFGIELTFGNGERAVIDRRMVFARGSRTAAIDLPGENRVIKKIEFRYGNLPGGGKATVAVFGKAAPADGVKVRDHRGKGKRKDRR